MRKDVILGMTIGGGVLAVIIGYLVLNPSKKDKHTADYSVNSPEAGSETTPTPDQNPVGEGAKPATSAGVGAPTRLMSGVGEKDSVWYDKLNPKSVQVTPGPVTQNDSGNTDTPGGGTTDGGHNVIPNPNGAIHTPVAAKSHTHRVQQGETFSTIAAAAYGSSKFASLIVNANPKVDPRRLKVNTEINLPDISEAKSIEAPASTRTAKAEAAIDSKTEYRVQQGDNLNRISMKVYGRIGMVDKIYQMNKGLIGSDPARLKLGTVLKLPPATTTASTN